MPWHSTDCQAALVSELHWLYRGQQKDCSFAAHPPGLICLTAPYFQWHDYVGWLQCEPRIPLLSRPIPSERSKAFASAWWGLPPLPQHLGATPYQKIKIPSNATHQLCQIICSEWLLPSWLLKTSIQPLNCCRCLMQLLASVAVLLRRTGWQRKRGCIATDQLSSQCSGFECFPHLHGRYLYSESVSVRLWWCCQGDGWWDLYDGSRLRGLHIGLL